MVFSTAPLASFAREIPQKLASDSADQDHPADDSEHQACEVWGDLVERDRRAERTRGSALGSARGSAPGSAQRRGGHRGEEVRQRRTLRARGSARGRDHGDRAKAQRARSALARRSIGSARSSARGNARDSALLRVVLR